MPPAQRANRSLSRRRTVGPLGRLSVITYYPSRGVTIDENLTHLEAIGFKVAGEWNRDDDGIACKLDDTLSDSRNVLYAFVVDGQLTYVGKTIQSLRARMAGYRSPGPTQFTNIKNKNNILNSLNDGKTVKVYALPDNGLLHYGIFHVNLAAGLEDSIVKKLSPPWNGGQKETPNESLPPLPISDTAPPFLTP